MRYNAVAIYSVLDMNSALTAETRREYIPVGSTPASLLATVSSVSTKFTPINFVEQQ